MWNSSDRDGIQKKLAEHFGISIPTVYRIRKELHLADLHDAKNHPGKRQLLKRIRKLYVTKERSSLQIGKILKMSPENIRKMLMQMKISMRPSHCTNSAYFKTRQTSLTPHQLLQQIRKMYIDEHLPASHIAEKLGINEETVRTKLRAMKIHKARINPKSKNANCQWCNKMFKQYIDNGPRTQLYCCSRCSDMAKDYRRMMSGMRVSQTRIKSMEDHLKNTWKDRYKQARQKILSVKPALTDKRQIIIPAHCAQTYQEA